VLLARHEAGMRAVALGIIGYGPDTDDVVQDAALVAVRRISDVRNPAAVGPWLRAVVRNECRMRLRSRHVGDRGGEILSALPSEDPMPEELIDRQLLQDWVWHAIEELSPSLRVVAMLRYFSDVSSYEQIAVMCELPIGTVRSRLSQVRVKLTEGLSATAEHVHENASAKQEICRQDAVDTLAAANRGAFSEFTARLSPHLEVIHRHGDRGGAFTARLSPHLEVIHPHGDRGGANLLLTNLRAEHEMGTCRRPVNVVVGGDVVIWETQLIDSSNNSMGGPSAAAWVMSLDPNGLVRQMRLFELSQRSEAPL
jgi:RNA polymerase sigma-70 factor (ECF subfamily)